MHPQAVWPAIVRRGPLLPKSSPVLSPQFLKKLEEYAASHLSLSLQLSLAKAACSRASIDHVALGSGVVAVRFVVRTGMVPRPRVELD